MTIRLTALLFALLPLATFAEVISKKLTDVIAANGTGIINVFDVAGSAPDLTPAELEAFRLDNDGQLVFAIDVNEAANGTEKASSQAVTFEQVSLTVTTAEGTQLFEDFWTQTQTLVAPKGSTVRSTYYTAIGDTGSSRITTNSASDIDGSDFDATLTVPVDLDLSSATEVTLTVILLDVNSQLGDPEAYYDYSNGFEDMAIVSKVDALYLDALAAGQAEAPLVISAADTDMSSASTQYFPSASEFVMSAFEDRYPSQGDYDFNDLVVAYRIWINLNKYGRAVSIGGEGYLVAKGALFDLDWGLWLDLPGAAGDLKMTLFDPISGESMLEHSLSTSITGQYPITLIERTKLLWQPVTGTTFINTETGIATKPGHKFEFTIQLSTPQPIDLPPTSLLQPFIYVHPTGQTIYNGMDFVNDQGYPFGLVMPQSWVPPSEQTDIGKAYPDLVNYIKSGGNSSKSWYNRNNANFIAPIQLNEWQW